MMCNCVTTQSGGTSAWPPASCRGVCKMAGMWSTRSSSDRLGRHTRRSLLGASAESFSWCSDADEEPGSNQKASRNEPENKRRGKLSISEELMLPTWLFALITTSFAFFVTFVLCVQMLFPNILDVVPEYFRYHESYLYLPFFTWDINTLIVFNHINFWNNNGQSCDSLQFFFFFF